MRFSVLSIKLARTEIFASTCFLLCGFQFATPTSELSYSRAGFSHYRLISPTTACPGVVRDTNLQKYHRLSLWLDFVVFWYKLIISSSYY